MCRERLQNNDWTVDRKDLARMLPETAPAEHNSNRLNRLLLKAVLDGLPQGDEVRKAYLKRRWQGGRAA